MPEAVRGREPDAVPGRGWGMFPLSEGEGGSGVPLSLKPPVQPGVAAGGEPEVVCRRGRWRGAGGVAAAGGEPAAVCGREPPRERDAVCGRDGLRTPPRSRVIENEHSTEIGA